ncbi:MAG: RagB/SusD family nutrient uptake outer membrane protein [Paludibacteraceae bacterium]|nr:RagB/SusD family nutrient uptake outer membrane protein [Paludibacteraceae bacterium]
MKTRYYIYALVVLMAGSFTGCKMDYFPDDELNASVLMADPAGAKYIMDGCYATLKDEVDYLGYASGNSYPRHYTQMAEFQGDNICLAGRTTDPLYEAMALMMTDNLKNVGTLWWLAYKVIYMSNTVIENNEETGEAKQFVGEAYYMRALMHLHLVTLYAKPYGFGEGNPGVPLRTTSDSGSEITRATVGEVYNQIIADLNKAAELLGASRGNAGYPSHDAALGLLTRVYLYMEQYDKVISTYNTLLAGAKPIDKLDANIGTYFANTKTSKETLFCIAHETVDDKAQASAGSMYNGDGGGWGEIYPSDPLLYMYERYPMDKRYTDLIAPQYTEVKYDKGEKDTIRVTFPDPETPDDAAGRQNLMLYVDTVTKEPLKLVAYEDVKTKTPQYEIIDKTINGEYHVYYINYKGQEIMARVTKTMNNRYMYPKYFVKKFGYQDGSPTLCSPAFSRWGEVILNAAEAYAKQGQNANALECVNAIRTRAGIGADGLFEEGKMHGYSDVLSVVLDERRLELAFEGFRPMDMIRNKMNIDRRYPGAHPWGIIEYNNLKLQYPIPYNEHSVSHIGQNDGY